MITRRTTLGLLAAAALPFPARAATGEAPILQALVDAGDLPPMADRLPRNPRVMNLASMGREVGRHGGVVRTVIGGQRDIRLVPIYSYSRLVGYDHDLNIVPDILASVDVEADRVYTFHLREGHRWSDGAPFTADDFRYMWDDVINNKELLRGGPPVDLKADGVVATFEVIDPLTVRYSWPTPNPDFLNKLAAPGPLLLALPAHYMRQFHATYQTPEKLAEFIEKFRVDDWSGLHVKMSRQNRPENPDLPTLEAWRPRTAPPAERFVFERNPFFHRVDETGQQLPYIDQLELNVASVEVIPAKTATGEADLQSQGIGFTDYTLLKQAEKGYPLKVSLWRKTQGSAVALYPNLTCNDTVWRDLFRDVRMRRALSVAINREELNKVLFYGLGQEAADTLLPESVLFRPEYATAWTQYDPDLANSLLDELGLVRRALGERYLPDGRKAGIVVESAGESTLETDVLELITDHYRDVGLSLYIRTSQRDVFRSRALAGDVTMAVWQGLNNGVATPDMAPTELAPTAEDQYQWPVWGLYYASAESSGTPPELPKCQELVDLLNAWRRSTSTAEREAIWHKMLTIRAEQVYSIGTVSGALQPILRSSRLKNVPDAALYGFEPTSYFGAYAPDTFFYDGEG